MKRTPHPPEVKAEALRRLAAGDRPSVVAREMGMAVETLRQWRLACGQVVSMPESRNADGTFKKGVSGNPDGFRSIHAQFRREAERQAIDAQQSLGELARHLGAIVRKASSPPPHVLTVYLATLREQIALAPHLKGEEGSGARQIVVEVAPHDPVRPAPAEDDGDAA